MRPRTIIILLLVIAILITTFQNLRNLVPLEIFFWEVHVKMAYLVFCSALVGVVTGILIMLATRRRPRELE